MENPINIDHFFSYNDIVIFPAKMITIFPVFISKINQFPLVKPKINNVIIASVFSHRPLTVKSFDLLERVDGLGVLKLTSPSGIELTYLEATDLNIKSKLILAITTLITRNLICSISINSPTFQRDVTFFVKNGFISPIFNEKRTVILLTWLEIPPESATLNTIARIVSSVKTDRCFFTMIIPKSVAHTLVKTVKYMYEAGGVLFITHYTDNGEAVLGINSDYITEGTSTKIDIRLDLSPINFHCHPETKYTEYDIFIAWPSGLDIKTITSSFYTDTNQLAHFIVSAEGIWILSLTFEFQLLINHLKTFKFKDCMIKLLDAIFHTFTATEYFRRKSNITPLDRHKSEAHYTTEIAGFTIGKLLALVPTLSKSCTMASQDKKSPLYKLSFIPWSRFDGLSPEVIHTVEYAQDIKGGLPVVIPPFNPYSS